MNQPQRRLPFERVHNFRDLGGYVGAGRRQVVWGALFRSAQLSLMTERDKLLFRELGVELVCDFRRDDERLRDPSPLEAVGIELISLAITPGSTDSTWSDLAGGKATAQEMIRLMEAINRDLVLNQTTSYRQLFRLLLQGRRRVLIHCAVGKDRTGVAAALILSALGVDRDTIMEDYLLTNQFLPVDQELQRLLARYSQSSTAPAAEILRPVLEARESYLAAAFAAIDEQFGSTAAYLQEGLGLGQGELAQLQAWYLQDVE
jgi:protein-tyrosine phosphatase